MILYLGADDNDKLKVFAEHDDTTGYSILVWFGGYKARDICDAFAEYFDKGIQTSLSTLDFKAKEDTSFNFGANVKCQ